MLCLTSMQPAVLLLLLLSSPLYSEGRKHSSAQRSYGGGGVDSGLQVTFHHVALQFLHSYFPHI